MARMPDIFAETARDLAELARHGHLHHDDEPHLADHVAAAAAARGSQVPGTCTDPDHIASMNADQHAAFHGYVPSQAPATRPVNLAAATPAAARPMEEPMSFVSDVEQGYAAFKGELAKFEQALPTLVAQGRKLEGNPLAQLAFQAGEHLAAGILPPEALEVIASTAGKVLDGLLALYNPQAAGAPSAPGAVAQPAVPLQ